MNATVLLAGVTIWLLLATVPVALLVAAGQRERQEYRYARASRTSEDTLVRRSD